MKQKEILLGFISIFFFTACVPMIDKQRTIGALEIKNEMQKCVVPSTENKLQLQIKWWEAYGDAQLNELLDKALATAPSMQSLQARYAQASSLIASVRATNMPSISATTGISRGRFSENYIFPPPLGGSDYSLYEIGATLDYKFDFWNERASKILSVKYSAMAQRAYIEEMKLLLSSAICEIYLSWNFDEKKVQMLLNMKNAMLEEETILNKIFKYGLIDARAIYDKASELATLAQEIDALKQSIEGKKESISILGGFLPSYAERLKSPEIKENFQVPLPKEVYLNLIARRADVSVQKYILLSKSQKIENAKAQFYPNISLSALIGLISLDIDKFLDHSSYAPAAGLAFSLPIFDGGAREANLKMSVSDYNSSVYDYNNVVIKAANEVVGVLKKSKLLESQISSHEKSIVAKERNKKIALNRFNVGMTNKLPYLRATREIYLSELGKIALDDAKASLQIELIKALGGGYIDNNESRYASK